MITFSVADVSNNFKQVNIHKATRPDRLPGCILRACTDLLASVFTDMFNLSLIQSVIPTCFKQSTVVLVPENAKVTCLIYYHPMPLTSVAMTDFESIAHIKHHPPRHTRPTPIRIPHQQIHR